MSHRIDCTIPWAASVLALVLNDLGYPSAWFLSHNPRGSVRQAHVITFAPTAVVNDACRAAEDMYQVVAS